MAGTSLLPASSSLLPWATKKKGRPSWGLGPYKALQEALKVLVRPLRYLSGPYKALKAQGPDRALIKPLRSLRGPNKALGAPGLQHLPAAGKSRAPLKRIACHFLCAGLDSLLLWLLAVHSCGCWQRAVPLGMGCQMGQGNQWSQGSHGSKESQLVRP